jgi:hypothetical protein
VDWVLELAPYLAEGQTILSVVSSADIDAIGLHLFAISRHLPRKADGSFAIKIYVMLKKSGVFDLYNITKMITTLEKAYNNKTVCSSLAMALCLGGNDFLPKFQTVTHLKVVQLFMSSERFRRGLFQFEDAQPSVCQSLLTDFIKTLFCPKSLDAQKLSYDEVRQVSIKPPRMRKTQTKVKVVTFSFTDGQANVKHPKLSLPPRSCLLKLCTLYDAMMEYLLSLGQHDADLPDFTITCLMKQGNTVVYDLGDEEHVDSLKRLTNIG